MSNLQAAAVVLNLAKLIQEVVLLLGLDSLVIFAAINRAIRARVKYYLSFVVSRELAPFFPAFEGLSTAHDVIFDCSRRHPARKTLWAHLHSADGVISGALTSQVIRNSGFTGTPALDIIVPHRKSFTIRNFLVREGYQLKSNLRPNRVEAGPCRRYAVFKSTSTGCQANVAETNGPSVLTCILGWAHTAFMNAITPMAIYSFYPSYTSSGITLEATHSPPDPVVFYRNMGLEFYPSAGDLSQPCGIACPQVYRRVRGGRGILQFCWNDMVARDVSPLETHELDWWLGSIRDNESCTYF